ncbi:hypothetical protein DFH09DRAFT_1076444 [Mycena vulgaris]|nr:hypothetical protein DFH09DRAFT_1076444 [Mycena vulgaris]
MAISIFLPLILRHSTTRAPTSDRHDMAIGARNLPSSDRIIEESKRNEAENMPQCRADTINSINSQSGDSTRNLPERYGKYKGATQGSCKPLPESCRQSLRLQAEAEVVVILARNQVKKLRKSSLLPNAAQSLKSARWAAYDAPELLGNATHRTSHRQVHFPRPLPRPHTAAPPQGHPRRRWNSSQSLLFDNDPGCVLLVGQASPLCET